MSMRLFSVAVMVLLPGGLVVLGAVLLARAFASAVSAQLRSQRGSLRLVRAVSAVRVRDVWTEARRAL